jgi:pantoate--beta-alanine ligase
MKIIRKIKKQQKYSSHMKNSDKKISFVPTMGFLHEGHLSLINKAKEISDKIVVSIFVNPTQFGKGEDLDKYPRDEKRDQELLAEKEVDIVFIPDEKEMYPEEFLTFCQVHELSKQHCGKSRPGHFKGVTTVVLKLFNIIQPDIAIFGEKDYQQYVIIKKMTEDLNLPINIIASPIVREKDGLAMSSRNKYLNNEQRKEATVLYEALTLAKNLIKEGNHEVSLLLREMSNLIKLKKTARIDYINFTNPETLRNVQKIEKPTRILMAVWIGNTRLIDNMEVKP